LEVPPTIFQVFSSQYIEVHMNLFKVRLLKVMLSFCEEVLKLEVIRLDPKTLDLIDFTYIDFAFWVPSFVSSCQQVCTIFFQNSPHGLFPFVT
jgi:hypothetical protein